MLTSDQSIVTYADGKAFPDRLTRVTHKHYLEYAKRMLAVYRSGAGMVRRELHRSIAAVLAAEPDCDRRRIAAFCKLLDDAAEFDVDRKGNAAALRLKVFAQAAASHPLVDSAMHVFERTEHEVKRAIAAEVGRLWAQIDAALYSDVLDRQALMKFDEGPATPEAFLSRYNLAQLQACLYRATWMTVTASADFASIVRRAKLARLLVDTRREKGNEYRIDLSGPASVLHETRRYGVNFARFVGSLVACRGWTMRAGIVTRWGREVQLRIGSEDGYRSHLSTPEAFDSTIESLLASEWGESRAGWRLIRDAGILQSEQVTFVPDFLLRHDDGREVFLEIVGFWTPEYLAAKRRTLRTFKDQRMLLVIPERTAKPEAAGGPVVVYRKKIKPDAVVAAAEAIVH